jgi:hypothetical protein
VPPGAPRDLPDLCRLEVARFAAVELAHRSERHVPDVEVQTHADCIGGHDPVDLAGLIHRDLRVACTGREHAQHDCGSTPARAQPLRGFENLVDGERDHRATRGDLRQTGGRCVGEARQPG